MGSFQVKKMRIKYLPQVYELHKDSFPNPAKARYYETLRGEKDSPFYIALNDDDEVVGYIATRLIKPKIYSRELSLPSLIVAAFTTKKDSENEYQEKKIKDGLLEALMVQLRIGGFEEITADIRESQELSKQVFSDFGFNKTDGGKYKDGEPKLRFTYSFDIELVSKEFRIERVSYKHLNRVKMLHNKYLLAEKDYGYFSRIMKKKGSVMLAVVDEYLVGALANSDHASIIIFCLCLGGVSGIVTQSGGGAGLSGLFTDRVKSRKGGVLATWFLGLMIFLEKRVIKK